MLYLTLPVIIFFVGWIKIIFSIPLVIVLLYTFKRFNEVKVDLWLPMVEKRTVFKGLICVLLIFIWAYMSGVGGFVFQNADHLTRNNIFRILVESDWPVVKTINTDGVGQQRFLSYYIGFWLPAAIVGKVFGVNVGFVFQLFWCFSGLILVYILMCSYMKRMDILTLVVFIFFSGMDIIGFRILGGDIWSLDFKEHIEWWTSALQFSSNTTQIFFVFNQCIYGWLVLLLILHQKDNKHIVFIISCCMLSATFPFVGIIPFFLYKIIKNGDFKNLLTIENILGGGSIGIISFFYLISNVSANKRTQSDAFAYAGIRAILLFLFIEVGIYFLLILKLQYRNILYWIALFTLTLTTIIKVGSAGDFTMRASIPALLILNMLVVDSLREYLTKKKNVFASLLIITLLIGSITPMHEIYRTVYFTWISPYRYEQQEGDYELRILSSDNFSSGVNSVFARYIMK